MDGGLATMEALLGEIFADPDVREARKKWLKWARFNNAIKRVINELSTVYSEPAQREVGAEGDNEKYQQVQELSRQPEQFIRINRLLNLHRALLVGFRVRELPNGDREPVIDIATPSIVRAVIHPNDPTQVVGWLIRVGHANFHHSDVDRVPSWVLETDHERVLFNDTGGMIGQPTPHGFARSRWVSITRGPVMPGFWPGEEGEDLVAAQVAIWFANVCMLKETKSATNQTIYAGDVTGMARGQASDSEMPINAPDGVSVSTVDMSMDVGMFGRTADHILEGVANNYGMSAALIKHQGVQSAEARELMRVPIRELRREQQVPFRMFEKQFVEVQRMVLERDMPELAFSTDGWRVDFGEAQTPLTEREQLDLFEKQRQMGVANTVDFIRERNPDLNEDQAIEWMERNVAVEVIRNRLMRPLYAMNGALGQPINEAQTPEQNGAVARAEASTNEEQAA